MSLTLPQAAMIVEVSLRKGRETGCAPLAVAVLDAGGHLKCFAREDGAGIIRTAGSRARTRRSSKAPIRRRRRQPRRRSRCGPMRRRWRSVGPCQGEHDRHADSCLHRLSIRGAAILSQARPQAPQGPLTISQAATMPGI